MKGNRQGSLSRSITRRSGQNCKIILQILILQFCRQLVKKSSKAFFGKLKSRRMPGGFYHRIQFFVTLAGLTGVVSSVIPGMVMPLSLASLECVEDAEDVEEVLASVIGVDVAVLPPDAAGSVMAEPFVPSTLPSFVSDTLPFPLQPVNSVSVIARTRQKTKMRFMVFLPIEKIFACVVFAGIPRITARKKYFYPDILRRRLILKS